MSVIPMLMSGSLSSKLSGVSRSALARARYFDSLDFAEPVILVHAFHAAFDHEIQRLRESGELSQGTKVRNMFSDLGKLRKQMDERLDRDSHLVLDGLTAVPDSENSGITRYYDADGEYLVYANWGDGSFVPVVNLIHEGTKYKTLWLRDDLSVNRARRFSSDGQIIEDQYFNEYGQLYLSVTYLEGKVDYYRCFVEPNNELVFSNLDSLIEYWLTTCNEDILEGNCLISEWAYQMSAVQNAKGKLNFKDIYVFHGSHILTKSPRYRDEIVPFYRKIIEGIPQMSACVVLTDHQKFDLQKRSPTLKNISVIPHVVEGETNVEPLERKRGLVVSISQLREVKGIKEFVPFFARVVEKCRGIVEPKLEIYGSGPEKGAIENAIEAADLGDYVKMMGAVPTSAGVYSEAEVSVFPSQREGQPLSLFESIAHGCVPVAFDFKYGARSGIDDGENGFVVDLDNYAELADSVALLLIDQELRSQMSEACITRSRAYSPEDFVDLWRKLFERLGVKLSTN